MPKINGFEFISPDKWYFLSNPEVEQAAARATELSEKQLFISNLEQRIEEYLRQWIIKQLIEVYGYSENWLRLKKKSARNTNLTVRDESNNDLVLVAARNFGDSDSDFEQAIHILQSQLEASETAHFALMTDGQRIAFLCKSAADQIEDYKAVSDLPNFDQLKKYVETGQVPALSAVTNKFRKLPAPKPVAKRIIPPVTDQLTAKKQSVAGAAALKSKQKTQSSSSNSNRRGVALFLVAILVVVLGVLYVTKGEPLINRQTTLKLLEKGTRSNVGSVSRDALQEQSLFVSNIAHSRLREAPKTTAAPPEKHVDSEATLEDREEISVLEDRRSTQSSASGEDSSLQNQPQRGLKRAVDQSKNRKILSEPAAALQSN